MVGGSSVKRMERFDSAPQPYWIDIEFPTELERSSFTLLLMAGVIILQ